MVCEGDAQESEKRELSQLWLNYLVALLSEEIKSEAM